MLNELDISSSELSKLPESIGNLTNLSWFNIRDNQLIELPESIGSLINLEWLNLRGSQLTALPKSIGNLTNLSWINIRGNQLIDISNLNNLDCTIIRNKQAKGSLFSLLNSWSNQHSVLGIFAHQLHSVKE